MPSQVFKTNVPNSVLYAFLKKNCDISDDMYIFNNEAYKRAVLNESIEIFKKAIVEYYHISKREYVNRKQSFVRLATIIRQICKHNMISHVSKIKYRSAGYDIIYYISAVNDNSANNESNN
jgi:mRNA-degrading endonuclease RelE of RelBE toxin-antitoxin system